MADKINRRRFIRSISAGGVAVSLSGLAGCTGNGGGTGQDASGTTGGMDGTGGGTNGNGGGTDGSGASGGNGGPTPSQAVMVGGVTIPSSVVQQAREEGEVLVTATVDEPDLKNTIKPAFEEEFPEITSTMAGMAAAELGTKLVSEHRAGAVQTDYAPMSMGTARAVASAGVFRNFANDHWLKQAANELGYHEGYWRHPEARRDEFPSYGLPYTLLYNSEKISESEAPDGWEGLADDRWQDDMGIVMNHPSSLTNMGGLFATLYELWGEEKWTRVAAGIADNNPQLLASNSQAYRLTVQGEKALSPNYINDLVGQLAEGEDPPVATKWLDPSLQAVVPGHVVADSPNPNAGMVFGAWWLSEAGQQSIGDTGRTPVHGPTASTHNLFQQVIPEGTEILPQAYNSPTYNGADYLEEPDAWVPLFNEYFGAP